MRYSCASRRNSSCNYRQITMKNVIEVRKLVKTYYLSDEVSVQAIRGMLECPATLFLE